MLGNVALQMNEFDYLHEHTTLSEPQISWFLRMASFLSFGESVTRHELTLFTTTKEGTLVGLHDRRPGQAESVRHLHEYLPAMRPMWTLLLKEGRLVEGLIRHDNGKHAYLMAYPIVDNGGKIIGGFSFINPRIDSLDDPKILERVRILTETTFQAIVVAREEDVAAYEPISYHDGVIIFDDNGQILYGNDLATRFVNLLGFDRRLIGSSIYGSSLKLSFLKTLLAERRSDQSDEIYQDMVIRQTVIPISYGRQLGRSFLFLKDVTIESKHQQDLLVKNSVIKEIHHRVKNNLQTVAGLLRMEARRSEFPEVKTALQEGISRIESMALVHDIVSHYDEDYISIRTIFDELSRLLRTSMLGKNQSVEYIYRGDDMILSSHQASYVSLIINELISNSLQHGLIKDLVISLTVTCNKDKVYISLLDNGCGFPEHFNPKESKRLGLQIIQNLVNHELAGSICFTNHPDGGALVSIEMEREY